VRPVDVIYESVKNDEGRNRSQEQEQEEEEQQQQEEEEDQEEEGSTLGLVDDVLGGLLIRGEGEALDNHGTVVLQIHHLNQAHHITSTLREREIEKEGEGGRKRKRRKWRKRWRRRRSKKEIEETKETSIQS